MTASRCASYCGSSPRLWGTPDIEIATGIEKRFIPTAGGNAIAGVKPRRYRSVHPHGCGERNIMALSV